MLVAWMALSFFVGFFLSNLDEGLLSLKVWMGLIFKETIMGIPFREGDLYKYHRIMLVKSLEVNIV